MSPTKGRNGSAATNGGFGTEHCEGTNPLLGCATFQTSLNMTGPVRNHSSLLWVYNPGLGNPHLEWTWLRADPT